MNGHTAERTEKELVEATLMREDRVIRQAS